MAWRIAGAAPAVLSLAKFMAPLPFGRIDVTYRHGSRRARNLVAPQGRSVVLLSRPESRRGDKWENSPSAHARAACVAGQNLPRSYRTAMLSQLRRRVPGGRNRPTTQGGASHDGAQARLSGYGGAAGATSGAIISRHFMRMPIARVEVLDGAAARRVRRPWAGRNEDREAGHGRDGY